MILERRFLATVDIVIWNGVMTILFGNMTVELNVFHTSSQPPEMDEQEEVNMIDTLVSHTFEESCYEDPLKKMLGPF